MTYSSPVEIDTSAETDFAHQLLLAWAAWVYGAGKLTMRSAGDVLNMPISEVSAHRILTEDQLLMIDKAICRLPQPMQRLITVHYRSSEDEPMTKRYSRLGCTRIEYRTLLHSMQSALYALLRPEIDGWRHSVL
jgi:hypothetical protein